MSLRTPRCGTGEPPTDRLTLVLRCGQSAAAKEDRVKLVELVTRSLDNLELSGHSDPNLASYLKSIDPTTKESVYVQKMLTSYASDGQPPDVLLGDVLYRDVDGMIDPVIKTLVALERIREIVPFLKGRPDSQTLAFWQVASEFVTEFNGVTKSFAYRSRLIEVHGVAKLYEKYRSLPADSTEWSAHKHYAAAAHLPPPFLQR